MKLICCILLAGISIIQINAQFSFTCNNGAHDEVSCFNKANYVADFTQDGIKYKIEYYDDRVENVIISYVVTKNIKNEIEEVLKFTFASEDAGAVEISKDPISKKEEYTLNIKMLAGKTALKSIYVKAGSNYEEVNEIWMSFSDKTKAKDIKNIIEQYK